MIEKIMNAIKTWALRIVRWQEKTEKCEDVVSNQVERGKEAEPLLKDTSNLNSTVSDFRSPPTTTPENCEREQVFAPSGEIESEASVGSGDVFSASKSIETSDVSKQGDAMAGDIPSDFMSAKYRESEQMRSIPDPSRDTLKKGREDGVKSDASRSKEAETKASSQNAVSVTDSSSGFTSSVRNKDKVFEESFESSDVELQEIKTQTDDATVENVSSDFASAVSRKSEEERVTDKLSKEELNKNEKGDTKPTSSSTEETEIESSSSEQREKKSNKLPRQMPARRMPRSVAVKPSEKPTSQPLIQGPELICRYGSEDGKWEIVLSMPNEMSDSVEVRHDEKLLPIREGECVLSSFSGNITVACPDGKILEFRLFDGESPLIFKLKNYGKGHGQRIRAITRGHFRLFVPSDWTRLGNRSDDYEGCVDPEFLAHHFFRGQNDSTDCIGGFEECKLLTGEGFVLEGERVMDDSKNGDLFVGSPPSLNPAQGIACAQIGEERPGGWKSGNFSPVDDPLEKRLDGRQGRFFVRVYNDEASLVDSGEFRYCSNLAEILVNDERYAPDMPMLPSPKGHPTAILQFVGIEGMAVHPKLENGNPCVDFEQDGTIQVKSSCPENDKTVWSLFSERGTVEIVIRFPRVWWKFQCMDVDSGEWLDKPSDMTLEEFRNRAKEGVCIRLYLPSSVKTKTGFAAGFNDDLPRKFNAADELPFDWFVDYPEIAQSLDSTAELKIRFGDKELTLVRIVPEISLRELPFARVKRAGGGWRCGKGFSIGELENAGLFASDAKRLGIPVDGRRRSIHEHNADILIEVMKDA